MPIANGTTELSRQLSDGSSEGNILGNSPGDFISFFGAVPVNQPTNPAQALIVDGSGGVASPQTGVAVVPAAYSQTEIANAFATIIANQNAIVSALVALGLIKGA